ncbi:MAG: transketolase [Actinomycetota bacterium]|nr:transketolase [Actinomycetota bacterium]MCL6093426.1 transketolase [Actinomycetota bacterium]MDA8166539.1 transketolase [Actinomycetota bacterium]
MAENHELDQQCINTLRFLATDAVQKANSGHPGMPMGAAPMAYVLWTRFLDFDPTAPDWPDRDRFILSAGHGSMLLYGLLYLTGYPDMTMEQIRNFRQWGSRTAGHPESLLASGIEVTTGPLGQGFGNGVGMAIAERYLASLYNTAEHPLVDHYIYAICSDGDLMEGVASEAASLAGHLGLGRLVYLYDDNRISIEGSTQLAFTEDRGARFEAYGWHVQHVENGNDLDAIEAAIEAARQEEERPSIIMVHTHIGYGAPHKQDTAAAHGEPLGVEEVSLAKAALGWPLEPDFYVPEEALAHFRAAGDRGRARHQEWQRLFEAYQQAEPARATAFMAALRRELPDGWEELLPRFGEKDGPMATRVASGKCINALAPALPQLFGGSADLAPSTMTLVDGGGDFERGSVGRNLHFGVREHGMGAIVNGMAQHGGIIPYGATFLIFSDYMRASIRLGALQQAPAIWVFTHDSVGLGEDGPTHEPVEHLMSLRVMPDLVLIRPADAAETAAAWRAALELYRQDTPVALALTRQKLPVLKGADAGGVARGAYVLAEAGRGVHSIDAIIIASGSEVHVALAAREQLEQKKISVRVVSMPSWELFDRQDEEYQKAVLPPEVHARLSVEAGVTLGWRRYVGDRGGSVGIDRYGASAPGNVVLDKLGINAGNVAARAMELLAHEPGVADWDL